MARPSKYRQTIVRIHTLAVQCIRLLTRTTLAGALTAGALAQSPGVRFADASSTSGLQFKGHSFGAGAWGDFDADGDPDLYDPHHFGGFAELFENLGDGTFREIGQTAFFDPANDTKGDFHGAAWADFDNDGDQDLLVCTGSSFGKGSQSQRLFVQESGKFYDLAEVLDVDYPLARGRTPLWLPFNHLDPFGVHDRNLDLIVGATERGDGQAPTGFFVSVQPSFQFFDVTDLVALPVDSREFVTYADVSQDGVLDLLFPGYDEMRVYATNTAPIQDITSQIGFPLTYYVRDAASGDFDGDGLTDVYLALSNSTSGILPRTRHRLDAVFTSNSEEHGLSFASEQLPGQVTFDLAAAHFSRTEVYIGANGSNPSSIPFTLDMADPSNWGIAVHQPGVDHGIFIGIDSDRRWKILASSPQFFRVGFELRSRHGIMDPEAIGFAIDPPARADRLLLAHMDSGGTVSFADHISSSGIDAERETASVVAADFDNDLDLDFAMVDLVAVRNAGARPRLYFNQGDGTFVEAPGAAGLGLPAEGRADALAVVDYDNDGFLDLYVASGEGDKPFSQDGETRLYRNLGNSHHWLKIDLQGTRSNRDGIGAKLTARVGGRVLIREHNGGMHRYTQNDASTVHFGLGSFTEVRKLEILWPSGTRQTLTRVPADQCIVIVEP